MKKVNILIGLGLFVLLVGIQPVQASRYAFGERELFIATVPQSAQLNADISKFEGLLNAYINNNNERTRTELHKIANEIINSLGEFNAALLEIYPTLAEEEQISVKENYGLMESSLIENFEEASVFSDDFKSYMDTVDEVFKRMESSFDPD